WINNKGMNAMRGPASFSVNDECGLLMDAFDLSPIVMMTYNPEYYIKLFENWGFEKSMDLLAYNTEVKPPPERLKRLSDKIEKRGHFTVRNLKTKNKNKLREDIEKIFTIYETAWSDNWGYVPMSAEEFDLLVDSLLPIILPELIFIAEVDGEAVGLSVTLPDYNYVLKKMKGKMLPFGWLKFLLYKDKIPGLRVVIMGVLDEYKGRGIDVVMYCKTHEVAQNHKTPFKEAEFSWILESNTMMNKIATTLDAKVYKTYRMYDKPI
ncbi:MAG: GNAT family N-acetyltransferase, partial [FCB group bacterium]|nr:GNAT family N-acetyltransferase [FCB group bacterium]